MKAQLLKKIDDRSAVVGIVGLGYVGLPLAVAFAEAGCDVVGVDTDPRRLERLRRSESDVEDVPSEQLRGIAERFTATDEYKNLAGCEAVVMCVPTPLANHREPDLSYLVDAATQLSRVLHEGRLVVLESTTYPGTTRERLLPILEESGLAAGREFNLAYSPERIDPGRTDHTVRTTPKVVGGLTDECRRRAAELYGLICDEVVEVSSPEVAELTKLLENIFRSVNIALVNELAQLCDRMDIDVWEVVDAAGTKPFGFMRFDPGPGMGGHCLPIDPFYLAFKAREHDFYTEFIELAGKLNQAQPHFCVEKIERVLNDASKPVRDARVLLLGVAYKGGVGDLREAPALKIIRLLGDLGADIAYHDPHVPELPEFGLTSVDLDAELTRADIACIITAHPEVDHARVVREAQLVLDFRGVTRGMTAPNLVRL
jgi:UDP-N-acetyl-D-glucosamine dehydrogenase